VRTPKLPLWPPAIFLMLGIVCPATGLARPTARYVLRPSSPVAGQVAMLDASRTSCDLRPCSYRWRTVMRGANDQRLRPLGRGRVLRHTFRRPGVRHIRLTVRNRRRQESARTKRILVANAPTPSPAPVPTAAPSPAPAVTLQEVDGGPHWYGRFSNPLPTDPGFFPIGVWFESVLSQADIDKDKGAGLNTYVVLTGNSNLPLIAANGMKVIAQHGEWKARGGAPGAQAIAGWELRDEVDMQLGPVQGFDELQRILAGLPADGRLRYNNYGKGVMFWQSDAEAARFVNAQDLVSADTYWFTDNNICSQWEGGALLTDSTRPLTAAECHRAWNYGATVRRMRELVSPPGSKPVWAFVEVGHPFTEATWPTIQPAEVQAAVWHSLIAGARGVIYFNHSFGGPNQTQHALRDPAYAAIRSAVTAVNRRIAALAPVLNAPTVTSGWSQGAGTTAMVKWANGHFYLFAGSAGSAVTGTFALPCVGEASATALDEGRTIPVRGGSFADSFSDGNAVHIYRIDGGSSCGLSTGTAQPSPAPVESSRSWTASRARRTRVGRLPRRISLRSGRVVVPVTCKTACSVRSRLTMRAASRRIVLAARQRRFTAGRHKLLVRVPKRARRRVARAKRPVAVQLRTVIVEAGGRRTRRTQHLIARRHRRIGGRAVGPRRPRRSGFTAHAPGRFRGKNLHIGRSVAHWTLTA
jgi:hypothetical protein